MKKRLKPGRIEDDVNDKVVDKTASKALEPTRVSESDILKEVESEEKRRFTSLKAIGNFAKKGLLLGGLLASLIVIGTIYDVSLSASSMLTNMPVLGSIYLLLLIIFLGMLGYGVVKQVIGYRKLKRIDKLQQDGLKILKGSSFSAKDYALRVISVYENHPDATVRDRALKLKQELPSMLESEVIARMDDVLLKPLDEKAKSIIINYSTQTAVSTAISPVAFIDAILIISRSHAMIDEIAKLYGYRPNFLGEIALIKSVFINLAFASVTELLTHHSSDLLGGTFLSKLSLHGAQGVANGVLTARVGLGTIKSVRPLVYKDKDEGFLKNLTKNIINKIFNNKP